MSPKPDIELQNGLDFVVKGLIQLSLVAWQARRHGHVLRTGRRNGYVCERGGPDGLR